MIIIGIVLIVIGFLLFNYIIKSLGGPSYNRPQIFYNSISRNVIVLSSLLIFVGGLVCLWVVNPFVACLPVVVILLWMLSGFMLSRDEVRAKRFFGIYKRVKKIKQCSDEDALKEATKIYFQSFCSSLTGDRLDNIVRCMFDPKRTEEILAELGMDREEANESLNELDGKRCDAKDVADQVMWWEDSLVGHDRLDSQKIVRRLDEINKAYKKVIR